MPDAECRLLSLSHVDGAGRTTGRALQVLLALLLAKVASQENGGQQRAMVIRKVCPQRGHMCGDMHPTGEHRHLGLLVCT